MAIKVVDAVGNVSVEHQGRVLEVRRYKAQRNLSDTLDYSDYQTVEVTEALVYFGRTVEGDPEKSYWIGFKCMKGGSTFEIQDRFKWVDCSNLFVWCGNPTRAPEVDADVNSDKEMSEDLAAWSAYNEERERLQAEKHAEYENHVRQLREEEERNRPVVGKKMIVAKGRKVPVGTIGTVAHVLPTGKVLLKGDDVWQDRKANGTWVSASNLRAR